MLGDQLDRHNPVLGKPGDPGVTVLLAEVERESRHVASHVQRTVMFLSAMRHHAAWLIDRGYRVRYVTLDDRDNTQSFGGEVRRAVESTGARLVRLTRPGEWRVLREIEAACREADVELDVVEDPHFLVTPLEFSGWATGRKELVMEHFYRWQRRRLGVLMDPDGSPTGGEWNFDKDNREPFDRSGPGLIASPAWEPADEITRAVDRMVRAQLPDLPGRPGGPGWPVTREGALRALGAFVRDRLATFGTHQDAMWRGEAFLSHSLLSAALNLKLLDPRECVRAAEDACRSGRVPINAAEGFIRQIIGWREFIRGVYWHVGESYSERNALEARGTLPEFFWTGQTDMNCLKACVNEVLDHAFGHHIQRLMVTGNFALLAGISPRAVSDWYLGMYVDGVDWVTLPNTLGMALHADGGVVGTKPYAASGKYIERMSNYCEGCRYTPSERTGPKACPITTLYWDFLLRHRERFRGNRRMSMILANVDRMAEAERVQITVSARTLRDRLGVSEHS